MSILSRLIPLHAAAVQERAASLAKQDFPLPSRTARELVLGIANGLPGMIQAGEYVEAEALCRHLQQLCRQCHLETASDAAGVVREQ